MKNTNPDFLPPFVNLDGSYEEIVERLYDVFRKDFMETRAKHLHREVHYNGVINEFSQGKVEGFWHVISRMDETKTNRIIDYRRAERLSWAKPLMENPDKEQIKFLVTSKNVIASTSPDSQEACKRNVFLYNGALCEALAVMADGPMVLRTRLRAWFRRWRRYDW